jgi:flagellum-specific peptidoglycan hydrolase FlgJ
LRRIAVPDSKIAAPDSIDSSISGDKKKFVKSLLPLAQRAGRGNPARRGVAVA